MTSIESPSPTPSRGGQLVRVMTVLSGIGSFGTLLLSLSGAIAGLGESIVYIQGFAFCTVLIAAILYYELVRDKWPDRENRYLQVDLLARSIDPDFIPEEFIHLEIVTLETRERLALAERKIELAANYRRKIEEFHQILKKQETSRDDSKG